MKVLLKNICVFALCFGFILLGFPNLSQAQDFSVVTVDKLRPKQFVRIHYLDSEKQQKQVSGVVQYVNADKVILKSRGLLSKPVELQVADIVAIEMVVRKSESRLRAVAPVIVAGTLVILLVAAKRLAAGN